MNFIKFFQKTWPDGDINIQQNGKWVPDKIKWPICEKSQQRTLKGTEVPRWMSCTIIARKVIFKNT